MTRALADHAEKREHAAGASLLGAIGIVSLEIARGADSAVVNLAHTGVATLLNNLRGKIDFVMRWTNARTQLRNKVGRVHTEFVMQERNRISNNSQLAPLLAGMNETDGTPFPIDQIDRTTISYVDAKADVGLIGDQTIAAFKTAIVRERRINDRNFFSVNLSSRGKRVALKSELAAGATMNFIQICQNDRLIGRKGDARNTTDEPVPHAQIFECAKSMERKIAIFQPIDCDFGFSPRNRR
jgi:hypothetical protein